MIDKFLELGVRNFGQFMIKNEELSFNRINEEYNPNNVIWIVATEKQNLYIGETIDPINIVLKDLVKGNRNRATRDKIHSLIKDYSKKTLVYFLVGEMDKHSKQDLIDSFCPIGNKKGKY